MPARTNASPRSGVHLLRRAIGRQRGRLLGSYLLLALWQACEAMVPVLIGVIIDRGIATGELRPFLAWIGVLCALMGVLSLGYRFGGRLGVVAMQRETHLLRVEVAAHVLDPRGARTGLLPGETLSLATSDAETIGETVRLFGYTFGSLTAIAAAAVVLLRLDVVLGCVILLGVPLVLAVVQVVTPLISRRSTTQQETIARASGVATDMLRGIRPLRGIGGGDVAVGRYRRASREARTASIYKARSFGYLFGVTSGLSGVFLAVVAALAGTLAIDGEISLGEFVSIVGLTQFLAEPIVALGEISAHVASARASARRFVAFLATPRLTSDGASVIRTPTPQLELDDVTVGPLQGISFRTRPGGVLAVAIDDPAGAGALLAALHGELPVDAGRIRLGDVDLSELSIEARRSAMLVSPHAADLFEGTLHSNVDPGGALDTASLSAVIEASSADDVVALHEDGIEQPVTSNGATLSGGQRQRIALARALATDAPVLVLHDPTSAVDAVTEQDIAAGLRALRHGADRALSTVIITSSPALLDTADEVLLIASGAVAARGTHRELTSDAAYRQAVLR